MRKFLPIAILLQSLVLLTYGQQPTIKTDVIIGKLERVSAPLKMYESFTKSEDGIYKRILKNEKNVEATIKVYDKTIKEDPVVQRGKNYNAGQQDLQTGDDPFGLNESTVIRNWEANGITAVSPPDPVSATGPNHVVNMVNTSGGSWIKIFDKNGNTLVNNVLFSNIHAIAGAAGDPIVLYDKFADRWFLSEFTSTNPYKLVIAISKTNDPTGQYYVYSYAFGINFPDYPKFTVWPNAYYGTANIFPNLGAYSGSQIYAFNRAKMLAGDATAELVAVSLTDPATSRYYSMSPVGYQAGTSPAANAPGMFMYLHPEEWSAATTDVDSVGFITLNPNFTTPAASTVTIGAQVVAPYTAFIGTGAPQQGTTSRIQTLDQRLMNYPVYRNFGTHQSIYVCHTVSLTGPQAGIRWYEFRNTGSGFNLRQQGTFAPDANWRFMGSVAVNGKGEMALGYMISGASMFPSLRFAGRKDSDPLGLLATYEETSIIEGTVAQTQNNRSGDYSSMQVDPVDDTTFWFTGHYHRTPSIWGGYVRIAQVDLAEPLPWDARMISINSPVNGASFCSNTVVPNVTFKNSGANTITSLTLNARIDNGTVVQTPWTGSIGTGVSATINLASMVSAPGLHTLKIYTSQPNGNADMAPVNDTVTISFNILTPLSSPIVEGFESATFPPTGWRVVNPNAGSLTWTRWLHTAPSVPNSGTASAQINFWNYGTTGHLDYLLSPIVDAVDFDTVQVSFARAYRKYNTSQTSFNDTLMVQISTDCGVSFPITAWKKGGNDLVVNALAPTTANWRPAAGQWFTESINLKPFLPQGTTSFTVSFTGKNGFGQNVHIDDINIKVTKLRRRDATIRTIIDPFSRLCARTFVPLFEFGNKGIDTLKSVRINYTLTVNNVTGPVQSINWNGSLPSDQFATQALPLATLTAGGVYTLTAYTSLPNGLDDQWAINDTLRQVFTVFDPVTGPVREGFEQNTFPPANWGLSASNATYSWQRNALGSSEGVASAWMRNRAYNNSGAREELLGPLVAINNVDSVFLTFDRAHVSNRYPGSTAVKLDTLEVLLTKDCGKTLTSIYKKWGEDLQSVDDPNFPGVYPPSDLTGFVPVNKSQWKRDSVNITNLTGLTGQFQLVFRNINNNGNNTFIDNININPVTLPAKLKSQGYMISPNPSEGWVYVQHYLRPTDLRGLQVINSNGQVIWEKQYNGSALSMIPVDLTRFAAGIYTFRLLYSNKVISQRIVKTK
ncbi:MAG: T9SS C-terminal target domain-containing protein [Sphingobacteriales bacterium]|nr:MAG: T9SS C-terminal target domain-containing protein [Sphingobacteriales bacterium]